MPRKDPAVLRLLLMEGVIAEDAGRGKRETCRARTPVFHDRRRAIGKSIPAQSTADEDFPALAANFDPSEPPDDWPEIPDPRPRSSRERTRIAIRVAEWIARNAWRATPWGRAITIGHWLYDRLPLIESYRDAPRTLEELLNRAKTPLAGYDRHHIVERSTARLSGFSEDMINDPDNIVLIPRMRHWLINRW
ncbi:hypothetical protein [Georhizobium sp. MAB10]|uniref:hypothetical protein n=1 Tax=Georhizobium sp. MAB10 TaxID=3028319 RepID=UPI003855D7D6